MSKEFEQNPEIKTLANILAGAFVQRKDLYPRQLDDGSYVCVRQPLQERHLLAHLTGEMTLGSYCLDQDSKTQFIVLDADDEGQLARLGHIIGDLAQASVPSYLETSRRGGHLWLFFEQPLAGREARAFGLGLFKSYDVTGIELYPKQDRLAEGPGSLIRLPFGVHRKSGLRYGFLAIDGKPLADSLADQIRLLAAPRCVPEAAVAAYTAIGVVTLPKQVIRPSAAVGETLSEQIKSSVSVLDFVSQYVALSPSGRGRCPFHDDQHASFSVNAQKNYWYCFAGCGGGSIIDFWMKWKGADFTRSVRELAKMLL